jgi:predicted transcriptional regulator
MKTDEMRVAAAQAELVERVAKFEVSEIQSITVQANVFSRSGPDGRSPTVALRVEAGDPRYVTLEAMLKAEAATRKSEAETKLAELGMSHEVDQAVLDVTRADSLAAKEQHAVLIERNRQKRILAEALEAEKKAKA